MVPKSHITIEGETIELKCNFTIIKLGSNYPEPYAEWRHNATTVLQKIRPTKEDIAQGYLFSKLVLGPLTTGHTGFYECLAVDGMVRLDYLAERQVGQYVMSSPRAHMQVLSKLIVIHLSLSHSLTHSHTHTHSLTHSHTHTHTHTLSLSLSVTHSLSLSHSHTHTHTHTLTLSLHDLY